MRPGDNPFRSERLDALRYRPQGWAWHELLPRLRAQQWRGAIVGPHGSGKTTLLEALSPRLAAEGFTVHALRLDASRRRFPRPWRQRFLAALGRRDFVLLDGAEQMTPFAWHAFARGAEAAGGLVVTSHARARLPLLVECRPDLSLVQELVGELLAASPHAHVPQEAIGELFALHDGNVREVLRALYDRCAASVPTVATH